MATRGRRTGTDAPALPRAPADTASGYVRLSKVAGTDNLSLDGMVADIERRAEELGKRLIGPVHIDNGKSGAIRDRPEFIAWLNDARDLRADTLIPWHTDRLTREGVNAAAMILDVVEGKDPQTGAYVRAPVRLVDCAGLDSSEGEGFRYRFVIGAEVARGERERIKARNIATRARLLEAGRWPGGKVPLGFQPAPGPEGRGKVLVPNEAEQEAMRDALGALLAGESAGNIVRAWNAGNGPQPRSAPRWSLTTFRQALTSDTALSALWAPSEAQALDEVLETRPGANTGRAPAHLLSGIATCGGCRRPLYAAQRSGRRVYRCNRRDGSCPTPGVTVTATQLDDAVTAWYLDAVGGWPWAEARTVVTGAEDVGAARDEEIRALAAFQNDPTPEAAERYRLAKLARDNAEKAPTTVQTHHLPTGLTTAEEWASRDVAGRRAMLARAIRAVDVLPGQAGKRILTTERYEIIPCDHTEREQ